MFYIGMKLLHIVGFLLGTNHSLDPTLIDSGSTTVILNLSYAVTIYIVFCVVVTYKH